MFFLQFILYSSSFVGTLVKNKIPEAALELYQLNINQLSPEILRFRTKYEDNQDNPFTLKCFVVSRSFLFTFNAGSRGLGSNNFRNSSYREKTARSARVSRLSVSYDYAFTLTNSISSISFIIWSIELILCFSFFYINNRLSFNSEIFVKQGTNLT